MHAFQKMQDKEGSEWSMATKDEEVDEYDNLFCQTCLCNHEVVWFCNLQV